MKSYTPFQYMLIDVANHYGLDKKSFEYRIEWAQQRLASLEMYALEAKDSILFAKTAHHIRKVLRGEPTGMMVSLDCTASGPQLLAVLSGCKTSARILNLIDPDTRYDAYTETVGHMNLSLPEELQVNLTKDGLITRDHIKDAIVPYFYGSEAKPREILGDGTIHYNQFMQSIQEVFPGPFEVRGTLRDAWQPYAVAHSFTLPDYHTAFLPTVHAVDKRFEIQELGGATFTHRVYVNEGEESGISLIANVTHALDGYLVREMTRRCNYSEGALAAARNRLAKIVGEHGSEGYDTTGVMVSLAATQHIEELTYLQCLSLLETVDMVLEYQPFEIAKIHDSFWCSPLHMDCLRKHFIEILAELAEANVLEDILNEIYGTTEGVYTKLSDDLGDLIRECNYPLS